MVIIFTNIYNIMFLKLMILLMFYGAYCLFKGK
nr:MAG TPA: hypothetical protein [Caudoviricetes sp.]